MGGTDSSEQVEVQQEAVVEEEKSLIDQILEETRIEPTDESYDVARQGVVAFISELLKPKRKGEKVQSTLVNEMIAEVDKKISGQMDAVLHHEDFQKLESAWRGLKLVVDRTDFRSPEEIILEMLDVSKEDLLADFEDSTETVTSGLYNLIYKPEFGTLGGKPYSAMIANYEFGPGAQDLDLLQEVSKVAAMSHCPFIAAADPKFFGIENFRELPKLRDLKAVFEGPQYIKWKSFRNTEDARYVGLTLPRFLLRLPYDAENFPVKSFEYNETVGDSHESYLWGNNSFAFATRLTDSHARYGWTPNIIGPQGGGAIRNLPVHLFESMGEIDYKIPTEISITDRREYELSEQGFIGLVYRKGSDNAVYFSAYSVQEPKYFGENPEDKEAETNYKLGTQLPYLFVVSRLAHYIKVIQREKLGTYTDRTELERDLNRWISQYVSNMDNPTQLARQKRPLREAKITVSDVEGDPGWYRVSIQVRPHFKYMGAFFTLSLVGKLDQRFD